jgi:uncharacterized protein YacL
MTDSPSSGVPPLPPVVIVAQPSSPQLVATPYAPIYYTARPPMNVLSVVAFIFAFFISLVAVICGHIALRQIKKTGESGHGFALAAVVLGYIGLGLGLAFAIVYVLVIVVYLGSFAALLGSSTN